MSRTTARKDLIAQYPVVVDLQNRPLLPRCTTTSVRSGKRRRIYWPPATIGDRIDDGPSQEDCLSRLVQIIEAHERSGLLTSVESKTVRFLLLSGWDYGRIALYDKVTRQAVQQRIEGKRLSEGRVQGGVRKKAPLLAEMIDRFRRWPPLK